jgi:hypothetical protein
VVEAKTNQRILREPVRFNRIVASLAQAIRAVVDSPQGGIDFSDKLVEVRSRNRIGGRKQSNAPIKKLGPKCVNRRS